MEELIEEHIWARKTVSKLVDAKNSYTKGKVEAALEFPVFS